MNPDPLSATFAALADPTRRAILNRLSKGNSTVKELSEPFGISAPAITKHLKVLEACGLISRSRHAQQRPCILEPKPLKQVSDWLLDYKQCWEQRLDRLEDFLAEMQKNLDSQNPPEPNLLP